MRIASIRLFQYRLPLSRSLRLSGEEYLYREGLIVRAESEAGAIGWGEIAPLPGFSRETLQQATGQAQALVKSLVGREVPRDLSTADQLLESLSVAPFSSVRAGLESAILHLAAETARRVISFGTEGFSSSAVPLNGLLVGEDEDILQSATLMVNQGYRAVKLKVGRATLERDIALVYRVHARLGGKAALRLDANRAWTFEEAISFSEATSVLDFDYVEEPIHDVDRLQELGQTWNLPMALDESLVDSRPEAIRPMQGLKAVILKPTLLGGFCRTLTWVNWAKSFGVRPVVSSSFESDLGLMVLGQFASQTAPEIPCGLATSEWFKENLLQRSMPLSNGSMELDSRHTIPLDLRMDRLTELRHA